MDNLTFGNWTITDRGIERDEPYEYVIDKEGLGATRMEEELVYDWPMHIASKTWLTLNDLNDFNKAFFFALEHFGIPSNPNVSKEATLRAQRVEYDFSRSSDDETEITF